MNASYVSNAKRRAEKRGWEFDLDAEFLWRLYLIQNKKCALSGEPIFFYTRSKNRKNGNISLDRKDSSEGYTKDNVHWVHKNINLMKMYLSQSEFLEWCGKVWKYRSV